MLVFICVPIFMIFPIVALLWPYCFHRAKTVCTEFTECTECTEILPKNKIVHTSRVRKQKYFTLLDFGSDRNLVEI